MTVHMKPVRLAFATTPSVVRWLLGDATGSRVLAALVLLSSVAGLCTVAWTLRGTQQQQRGAVRQGASRDAKPAPTLQQSREWNQIVRQLNTPWPAILDTLERTTPETVALVAIEPDARNASVRLQVEAKTLDTLLAYAGSLQGAGPFDDVVLRKHETNEQDANRPMRLSFDARLKAGKGDSVPPAGGER
jgi:Tfp pilus assembly protein PilN